MSQRNSYIQIEIKDNTAICHYTPAVDGGLPINYSELVEYLSLHGIDQYDQRLLRDTLMSTEPSTCDLGLCPNFEFSETMYVKVSLDKMKATVRFWPPSMGGRKMDAKDIIAELERRGIVYGVDQNVIMDYLNDRCYATDYVMAIGTPPIIGHDAKITYNFNTNPSLKPKHNEDGTVDYKELNTINHVEAGALLAELSPMDPGAPGMDIMGRDLPTRSVKDKRLSGGKNIRISDDGLRAYSEVTGHVTLTGDQIFVSDVYEVPADVDNSTGNITYSGNVHIKGSVRSGFVVEAEGDVIIDGVVEDARVMAGGQIIVKRGIHGMHKGSLEAVSNVIIAFIENAKVISGGYIETSSIIYSEVSAKEDVMVLDRKGYVAGGIVRAGGKIECMTVGSEMGALTRLEVGIEPAKKERYTMLQKTIQAETMKIEKIGPVVESYNDFITSGKALDDKNEQYLGKLMGELRTAKNLLQSLRTEFNQLHQELLASKHAKVVIRRDIYPGVTVTISDLSVTTKDKRSYCVFEKKTGEIIVSNL